MRTEVRAPMMPPADRAQRNDLITEVPCGGGEPGGTMGERGGPLGTRIVIIAAHAFEARAAAGVGRHMEKERWGPWMLYQGEMWDLPMAIIRCGPGKAAAGAAAQAAVEYLEPRLLVAFGVATAVDPRVPLGTVVAAQEVVDVALLALAELPVEVPARFAPDRHIVRHLLGVPGVRRGTVLSWEGKTRAPFPVPVLDPPLEGVLVTDWESSAVGQVGEAWEVPWSSLRVVADHGEDDRLRRLAVVARRPLQWGAEVLRRGCQRFAEDEAVTQ
ncbi:MAG TPA: hypothetical protein ENK19_03505, partial [Acidobacteria bacterium]|nr:hypothetical protein [Acidobacteriota bacterium]